MQLAMDLALEKGASSWLTALPLEEHGFALHKPAFRDAMALRYGSPLDPLTHSISLCLWPTLLGAACSLLPEIPSIRHNELRDLTASLLKETYHGVATEPTLQLITTETFGAATVNTQDGACLDVGNGVWGGAFERAFFDVRVFNPFAPSNHHSFLASTYRQHENPHRWSRSSCYGILQKPSSRTSRCSHIAPQLVGYAVEFRSLFSGRRSCVSEVQDLPTPSIAASVDLTISDTVN